MGGCEHINVEWGKDRILNRGRQMRKLKVEDDTVVPKTEAENTKKIIRKITIKLMMVIKVNDSTQRNYYVILKPFEEPTQ